MIAKFYVKSTRVPPLLMFSVVSAFSSLWKFLENNQMQRKGEKIKTLQ